MKYLLNYYQEQNPEKFNDEFIYKKNKQDIVKIVSGICDALEIINGVTFKTVEYITNESDPRFVKYREKDVNISRYNLLILKFRIEGYSNKEKKTMIEDIDLPILFPKLINEFFFIHNGNRYYPIWQIADRDTYNVGIREKRSLVLKTLLLPIVLRFESIEYEVNDEFILKGKVFLLHLFNKKINFLYYFLNKFTIPECIEFLGMSDFFSVDPEPLEDRIPITISKGIVINVDQTSEKFRSQSSLNILCCFVDLLLEVKVKNYSNLINQDYWRRRLGGMFTKNTTNQVEKSLGIQISFERILDTLTKNILKLPTEDKEDIYALIRWMVRNYYELSIKDNMDLMNKRLRFHEYMVNPLLVKFSDATYRMLNNAIDKINTYENLKSIFSNIRLNQIIRRLIKIELLRYSNSVNSMDLFNSALKASFKGPQSMVSRTTNQIGARYRGLHPSYLDRISLTFASAGDPGMTVMFSPFLEIADELFFDDEIFQPKLLDVVSDDEFENNEIEGYDDTNEEEDAEDGEE